MRHHQIHPVLAREQQVKDLEVVVRHAAGKQPPAIAGARNALVFAAVAVAMHGNVAAKPIGRIGEQFTDTDVERLCWCGRPLIPTVLWRSRRHRKMRGKFNEYSRSYRHGYLE